MVYNILLLKRQYSSRFSLENFRLTAVTREYSTYRNFDYNYTVVQNILVLVRFLYNYLFKMFISN